MLKVHTHQIFNTSRSPVFLTVKLVLESARWGVDKKTERVSWVREYRGEDSGRGKRKERGKSEGRSFPPLPSHRPDSLYPSTSIHPNPNFPT